MQDDQSQEPFAADVLHRAWCCIMNHAYRVFQDRVMFQIIFCVF